MCCSLPGLVSLGVPRQPFVTLAGSPEAPCCLQCFCCLFGWFVGRCGRSVCAVCIVHCAAACEPNCGH